jgi:hypothetical protein
MAAAMTFGLAYELWAKMRADALTDSQGAKAAVNEAVENWKRTCDPSEVKKGLWWLLDTKTKTAIRKVA